MVLSRWVHRVSSSLCGTTGLHYDDYFGKLLLLFHCKYMLQVVLRVDCFQHDLSWLAGTLWCGPPGLPGVNRPIYSYGCGTLLSHVRLLARSEVHKGP